MDLLTELVRYVVERCVGPALRMETTAGQTEIFTCGAIIDSRRRDPADMAEAVRDVAADPAATQASVEVARRRYKYYRRDYGAARYVAILERLRRSLHALEAASR